MSYLTPKPIGELRSLAQFIGVNLDYGWDKQRLEGEITRHLNIKPKPRPRLPDESYEKSPRILLQTISTKAVMDALERYKEYGLKAEVVGESVKLSHTIVKEDTVPLRNQLKVIIECARRLING